MPRGDGERFPEPVEKVPQIHDAVDPVAVIDLGGILSGAEIKGLGGVEDHQRERRPGQDLRRFQRRRIGSVPGDDRVGALPLEARNGGPELLLQAAEGASHDLDPPGLEGLCQRFIKGLEPVTGGKSALVVKRDVKGQKSDFHGVDLLAFF